MNTVVPGIGVDELKYSVDAALQFLLGDDVARAEDIVMESSEKRGQAAGQDATLHEDGGFDGSSVVGGRNVGESIDAVASIVTSQEFGISLQRALNKARETFVASPEEAAARQRRISTIFHDFAEHVSEAVEQHALKMVASGWLAAHSDFAELVQPFHDIGGEPRPTSQQGRYRKASLRTPSKHFAGVDGGFGFEWRKELDEGRASFTRDGVCYTFLNHPDLVRPHVEQILAEMEDALRGAEAGAISGAPQVERSMALWSAFERVRKSARREVKARQDIASLHHLEAYAQVPICAAVEFLGFCFFAEVDMGFSAKTLEGGLFQTTSECFGRFLAPGDATPNSRAADHIHRALAVCCFLKSHPKRGVTSYGPVDLQVHVPPDGVVYLRCCKRIFPPVLTRFRVERVPSTISATSTLCQTGGRRLLPTFLENFGDGQMTSPDVWLDEPGRTVDSAEMECIALNHAMFDRAIPLVVDVLCLIDLQLPPTACDSHWNEEATEAPTLSWPLTDTARTASAWIERLNAKTLKFLLHQHGVNLCFLGKVLDAARLLLWTVETKTPPSPTPSTAATRLSPSATLEAAKKKLPARNERSRPQWIADVEDRDFIYRHPTLVLLRIEICSRAMRAVLAAELRRQAFLLSKASLAAAAAASDAAAATIGEKRSASFKTRTAEKVDAKRMTPRSRESTPPSSLPRTLSRVQSRRLLADERLAAMHHIRQALGDVACDLLSRCAGELLSSQADDDRALWENSILPTVAVMFGVQLLFSRAVASTSTVTKTVDGGIDLSTASRIRMRANPVEVVDALEPPAVSEGLGSVHFSTWGHLADPQFPLSVSREAFVLSAADKAARRPPPETGAPGTTTPLPMLEREGTTPPPQGPATAQPPSSSLTAPAATAASAPLVDERFLLSPPHIAKLQRALDARLDDVHLGACQHYRIVRKTCQMICCYVERRLDRPCGVSSRLTPAVCVPQPTWALSSSTLQSVSLGASKDVETALAEELKERKSRFPSTVPDAAHLRTLHKLALVTLLAGRLPQSSEWFRKSREVLMRDIGNNELGQHMTLVCEARIEMLRKRHQEAIDAATHAANGMQFTARDTRLFVVATMTLLDALDSSGLNTSAARQKKTELAQQLVPYCKRFGLAVGRIAAREAIASLTSLPTPPQPAGEGSDRSSSAGSTRSNQPQHRRGVRGAKVVEVPPAAVLPPPHALPSAEAPPDARVVRLLAAACFVVLREQGLDAEASSFAIQLFSRVRDPRLLPLAVALTMYSIPFSSPFFRASVDVVLQALSRFLDLAPMPKHDGSSVTLSHLLHQLTTHHSKITDPANILAVYRQQLDTRRTLMSNAGSMHVMVRGASSILNSTKKSSAFAASLPGLLDDISGGTCDRQGYYFLPKDVAMILQGGELDALMVHCTVLLFRQWLNAIIRNIPERARQLPHLWDVGLVASYGDLVVAVSAVCSPRPDVAVTINRMLSQMLDESLLPRKITGELCETSGYLLELFARESQTSSNAVVPLLQLIMNRSGYRLDSAVAPVCSLSTPFIQFLHDACFLVVNRQIQLLGIAEPRVRGAHVPEDDPKREPQLEWRREIFLSCEIAIELLASMRQVHRGASSLLAAQRGSPSGAPKALHTLNSVFVCTVDRFAASLSPLDGPSAASSTATPLLNGTSLPMEMLERTAGLFNPALLQEKHFQLPLRDLRGKYLVLSSVFPQSLERIVSRFPVQRHEVWHCYFRMCVAVYEAQVDLSAPIGDANSAARTEAQLRELAGVLRGLLESAHVRVGAIPRQEELQSNLVMLETRIASLSTASHKETSGLPALQANANTSPNKHQLHQDSLQGLPAQTHPPHAQSHSTASTVAKPKLSRATSRDAPNHAPPSFDTDHSPAPAVQSASLRRREETEVSVPRSEVSSSSMLMAIMAQPTPFFRVTPAEVPQGGILRVEWRLPTQVPPKYAAVGVFAYTHADALLIASGAAEVHKGIRFRTCHGDQDIRAPMQCGTFHVAFFLSAHSEALPLSGFETTCRVVPRGDSSAPLPKLRHDVEREAKEQPSLCVVPLPSEHATFTPCDSLKSRRERDEALLRRTLRDALRNKSPVPSRSASLEPQSRLDGSGTNDCAVVCQLRHNTSIVSVVHDEAVAHASRSDSEVAYRKALRTAKGTLEAQGALVVIVSGNGR